MGIDFKFIKPARKKLNERRAISREVQGRICARLAKRLGVDPQSVVVLKGSDGRVKAIVKGKHIEEFEPAEEQAIVVTQAWEKSGEGQGPIMPL